MKKLKTYSNIRDASIPDYKTSKDAGQLDYSSFLKWPSRNSPLGWMFLFTFFSSFTAILTLFYVLFKLSIFNDTLNQSIPYVSNAQKIAFGTNFFHPTNSDNWWKSLQQNMPSIWIWAGNFAYLEESIPVCPNGFLTNSQECFCKLNLLPKNQCSELNTLDMIQQYQKNFMDAGYHHFLEFMCPIQSQLGYPVNGLSCEHPILGTYGSYETPSQLSTFYKQNIFLDAMGEALSSSRRSSLHGIESRYIFNKNNPLKEISIFLLDDKFYADNIPCTALKSLCEEVLKSQELTKYSQFWIDFCQDSVKEAPCCNLDEYFWKEDTGYCNLLSTGEGDSHDKYKEELCDASSPRFGKQLWYINDTFVLPSTNGRTNFCEIFGYSQRSWLSQSLSNSLSRINLIVTSSPIFSKEDTFEEENIIHMQNWHFQTIAQKNFLSLISNSMASCIVILSGDGDKSEILMHKSPYEPRDQTQKTPMTIYQIVTSGLTEDSITAHYKIKIGKYADNCTPDKLCVYGAPTFGYVDIDWSKHSMDLQIFFAANGSLATHLTVDLHECTP